MRSKNETGQLISSFYGEQIRALKLIWIGKLADVSNSARASRIKGWHSPRPLEERKSGYVCYVNFLSHQHSVIICWHCNVWVKKFTLCKMMQ